jgi:hypothetical protein
MIDSSLLEYDLSKNLYIWFNIYKSIVQKIFGVLEWMRCKLK